MTGEWSIDHELVALGIEVAHQHYRAALAMGGVKKGKLPPALQFPRPTPYEGQPQPTTAPRRPCRADGRPHATTPAEIVAVLSKGFGPTRG